MASPEKHALLGASSAHRWITCPPSARLEEAQGAPDKGSVYAEEGTAAHAYAELLLSKLLGKINNRSFAGRLKKVKAGEYWGAEMEDAIEDYAHFILEQVADIEEAGQEPYVDLEQIVDFSDYVPEGFGTADVVILTDDMLHVIDLKYGKGVAVSAVDNPQLMLYALGAAIKYRSLFDFSRVRMSIVQPRLDSISSTEIALSDLIGWAENVVKPAADLAFAGEGEFTPSESACRWCRVKATCRARADQMLDSALKDFDMDGKVAGSAGFSAANPPSAEDAADYLPTPEILSTDEVAALLPVLPALQAWAKDIEDWALEQARDQGVRFNGYKLVEGRSIRKITDSEAAAKRLCDEYDYPAEDVYKDPELLPLGKLERLLGKKSFDEILGDLVEKPAGKPCLVPESDKRPEIGSTEGAIADFEETA